VPGILDLLEVCFHNHLRLTQLSGGEADVYCQIHVGLKPELRFIVWMRDVHMNSCLLTGKLDETSHHEGRSATFSSILADHRAQDG
jgi:hypothetical protein